MSERSTSELRPAPRILGGHTNANMLRNQT